MAKKRYINTWLEDWWNIASYELKQIFSDGGVLLIFLVAGLFYPILYNVIYFNGILSKTPVAIVDDSASASSREYIRAIDSTRECEVAYKCINMDEAKRLMHQGKVHGIIYFPSDYEATLNRNETAAISICCDMSSFLYYKNILTAANMVMLHTIKDLQLQHFESMGMTGQECDEFINFTKYDENIPYNRAFSYSIFLISAILLIIIQQTMFYGMAMLTGTVREQNRSFASLPDKLHGRGVSKIVLGRGAAYWVLYMGISLYIMCIVPAIFGLPQRGRFFDVMILALFFVTDCVVFSMTWSTLTTRRESVFILFLFMSPICLFLTGTSWPLTSFPKFWKWFSYLFPSTFGCRAFINVSTAGGNLAAAKSQIFALTIQTMVYYATANIAIYIENWVIRHKKEIKEVRKKIAERRGYSIDEDVRIIAGEQKDSFES